MKKDESMAGILNGLAVEVRCTPEHVKDPDVQAFLRIVLHHGFKPGVVDYGYTMRQLRGLVNYSVDVFQIDNTTETIVKILKLLKSGSGIDRRVLECLVKNGRATLDQAPSTYNLGIWSSKKYNTMGEFLAGETHIPSWHDVCVSDAFYFWLHHRYAVRRGESFIFSHPPIGKPGYEMVLQITFLGDEPSIVGRSVTEPLGQQDRIIVISG